MTFRETYSYDDVLLVPKYSEIKSRSHVNISVELSKGIKVATPFIPANMKTVVNEKVIEVFAKENSMTLMHRFDSPEEQIRVAHWISGNGYQNHAGMSVGVKEEDKYMVDAFVEAGIKIICIDVAHADSIMAHDMVKYISKRHPNVFLIAGNVASGDAARALWLAGVDAVKSGIGAGATCLTRIETGNGMPQLTAIMDAHKEKVSLERLKALNGRKLFLIADGGLTNAGNCVKALAFADMVMAGNMFAATEEGPGEIVELDGKKYKNYDGSSTYKKTHIEGVKSLSEYKGSIKVILNKLKDGLSSGCSYQGVDNLKDLKRVAEFVKVSPLAQRENGAHDVKVLK